MLGAGEGWNFFLFDEGSRKCENGDRLAFVKFGVNMRCVSYNEMMTDDRTGEVGENNDNLTADKKSEMEEKVTDALGGKLREV